MFQAGRSQRTHSFVELLDPSDLMPGRTIADLYSLRHLSLQGGIPDSPAWIRAQAWKVLLGYLPAEKKEWASTLSNRRQEYYQFVSDFSPALDAPAQRDGLSDKDALLDQIYKDLYRSRKNAFAFYQAQVRPSSSCPLAPEPADAVSPVSPDSLHANPRQHRRRRPVARLEQRHNILKRLARINASFAEQLGCEGFHVQDVKGKAREVLHQAPTVQTATATSAPSTDTDLPISPPIYLSPPSPGGKSVNSSQASFASAQEQEQDLNTSHSQPTTHQADTSISQQPDLDSQPSARSASPPSPPASITTTITPPPTITDRNWHSLLRILYIHALLNPSIGYVQGMNEALFTLFYVFGTAGSLPYQSESTIDSDEHGEASPLSPPLSPMDEDYGRDDDADGVSPHAEADAFWCFSILIGEVRELYEFDGIDKAALGLPNRANASGLEGNFSKTGMAGALKRLSLRLKWLDADLWRDLRAFSLDPRLPYYSFRWLACLISTELSLPSVLRVWDALLAEQDTQSNGAKIDFLIDVCCALLIHVKPQLPDASFSDEAEAFSQGMRVLQAYPDDDIGPILESALLFKQRRLAADLTGDAPPEDDEDDVSDTSLSTGGSVRARAAQALRGWANSTGSVNPSASNSSSLRSISEYSPNGNLTPAKGGWFGSMGRSISNSSFYSPAAADSPDTSRESSGFVSAASTPSRPPLSGVLQRYAEAIQSSDAAANLSKASTNLTAKALASFGSRESSPEPMGTPLSNRMASFGSVSAGFFRKGRSASSASNPPMAPNGSPRTPDMTRWSRETMPDFPLPNVSDSPAGRMEYTDLSGKRISMVTSPAPSETNSEGGSFSLPSLRAAAKLGILPRQREASNGRGAGAGPRPLLLMQSARPPREGSSSHSVLDEPSRKISTGPLAHNPGSRAASRTGASSSASERSSSAASESDSPNTSLTSHPAVPEAPLMAPSDATTVPASAFQRTTKPSSLDFGQAASSSDVPLVTGTGSISRRTNVKRGSSSTVGSASAESAWQPVELRDEPVDVKPRTSIVRSKRFTRARTGSKREEGTTRPVSDGSDLLRDDMFAAPTSGYEDSLQDESGLAAIGSSLTFPETDEEDSFL